MFMKPLTPVAQLIVEFDYLRLLQMCGVNVKAVFCNKTNIFTLVQIVFKIDQYVTLVS